MPTLGAFLPVGSPIARVIHLRRRAWAGILTAESQGIIPIDDSLVLYDAVDAMRKVSDLNRWIAQKRKAGIPIPESGGNGVGVDPGIIHRRMRSSTVRARLDRHGSDNHPG